MQCADKKCYQIPVWSAYHVIKTDLTLDMQADLKSCYLILWWRAK